MFARGEVEGELIEQLVEWLERGSLELSRWLDQEQAEPAFQLYRPAHWPVEGAALVVQHLGTQPFEQGRRTGGDG